MKSLLRILAIGSMLVLTGPAFAHEAHVHGVAHMNLLAEGQEVIIELKTPLANVLSFEHAPKTDGQKEEVREMAAVMRRPGALFTMPEEARCTMQSISLVSPVLGRELLAEEPSGQGRKTHDEHAHKADAFHSEGHHHHEDKHAHHGEGHRHDKGHAAHEHGDLDITVVYMCGKPEKLRSMTVGMFSLFPNLHTLEVHMATPGGQHAAQLSQKSSTLRWQP